MSTGSPSRRNSLRVASFGPPTVSCVLATARTCIRQAPPTSRGRGVATSAVADRMSGYASSLSFSSFEVLMKATMLFSPLSKLSIIATGGGLNDCVLLSKIL